MNRIEFFSRLLLGIPGLILEKRGFTVPMTKEVILTHPCVAGFSYYDGPENLLNLKEQQPFRLQRQPGNPFDVNAVEIFAGTEKLGYLPRKENKLIARMMDQGMEVKARICRINLQNPDWESVRVEVYVEKT
ncbi:MAG: DNA-binding protein [Bacteroidia bacterium]|nr:DNA-binding protein [Bacteroidia bacterium]